MWGYSIKCGTRVFCHLQFHLKNNIPDWGAIASNRAVPPPKSNVGSIPANGKNGSANSIYLYQAGSISQAGGGGMTAGDYTFDFDYETD